MGLELSNLATHFYKVGAELLGRATGETRSAFSVVKCEDTFTERIYSYENVRFTVGNIATHFLNINSRSMSLVLSRFHVHVDLENVTGNGLRTNIDR